MEMVKVKVNYTREQRMDIRDERVRLTRRLYALKDIEMWEPQSLTEEQKQQMQVLEQKITELKELEETMKS